MTQIRKVLSACSLRSLIVIGKQWKLDISIAQIPDNSITFSTEKYHQVILYIVERLESRRVVEKTSHFSFFKANRNENIKYT